MLISLTSFLPRVLEKIIDLHLRSKFAFDNENIFKQQNAYMNGKSVETAINELLEQVERPIHNKQLSLKQRENH